MKESGKTVEDSIGSSCTEPSDATVEVLPGIVQTVKDSSEHIDTEPKAMDCVILTGHGPTE
jgi:hypothetical protein